MTTAEHHDMAALLGSDPGQWLKVRDASGRSLAYGIPSASTPGLYYFANARECTCPAGQHGRRCWHVDAVERHVAGVRARQRMESSARRYVEIFGRD